MASWRSVSLLAQVLLIVGLTNVFGQQARIVVAPTDQTIRRGDTAMFKCEVEGSTSTNPFQWQEFITKTTGNSVYKNPNGEIIGDVQKYEVTGNYNLHVKNTDYSDGGSYACSVFSDNEPKAADLVVVETPSMDIRTMNQGMMEQITCSLMFGAAPGMMPDLRVKIGDFYNVNNAVKEVIQGNPHRLNMKFNYTATADHHDEEIECGVPIGNGSVMLSVKETLNIQFTVTDIRIAPQNDIFYVGEMVNCTARGSPAPTFRWEPVTSGGISQSSSRLEIRADMIGENRWKCVASNTVTGTEFIEQYLDFTVEAAPVVTDPPTGPSTGGVKTWVIVIAVLIPIAVVVAFVILGIIFYRKKKAGESGPKGPGYENKEFKGSANPVDDGVIPPDANNYETKKGAPEGYPVSMHPNPNGAPSGGKTSPGRAGGVPVFPPNAGRESPGGFADLGSKVLSGSGANLNASMDSFDDEPPRRAPAQYSNAPGHAPQPVPRQPHPQQYAPHHQQQPMYHHQDGGAPDTVV